MYYTTDSHVEVGRKHEVCRVPRHRDGSGRLYEVHADVLYEMFGASTTERSNVWFDSMSVVQRSLSGLCVQENSLG
jgi:hypothetical protein